MLLDQAEETWRCQVSISERTLCKKPLVIYAGDFPMAGRERKKTAKDPIDNCLNVHRSQERR